MAHAEQGEVVDVGSPVVLPLADVVGLAAAGVGAAAGEDAVPVADLQRPALPG